MAERPIFRAWEIIPPGTQVVVIAGCLPGTVEHEARRGRRGRRYVVRVFGRCRTVAADALYRR